MKKYLLIAGVMLIASVKISAQTCGTTNIALTKDASAYTSNTFNPASLVVDANVNTAWKSAGVGSQWITIDLGQVYYICRIKLVWAGQASVEAAAYDVQISNVDNSWGSVTPAFVETAGNGGDDEFPVTGSGRYVRVNMTAPGATWADHYELAEFEIYAGTQPPTNNLPSVNIVTPSDNSSLLAGNVSITANATDNDGSIAKVQFYAGTTLLGEDLTYPYSFTWSAAAGTYALTAKAIDNNAGETTSAAVNVTVTAADGMWNLTGNGGTTSSQFIGTTDQKQLVIKTNSLPRMTITSEGQIGINTSNIPGTAMLAVKGEVWAQKIKVTQTGWADYVFDSAYKLLSLPEVEKYINQHKHLPNVPSAKEVVQEGLNVGDNQAVLLRKIEELTLYVIEQNKKLQEQAAELQKLKKQLKKN